MTDKIKDEFNKLFTRKSKQTGKYRDDWFVKDGVTSKEIKDFITKTLQQQREEIVEVIKKHRPVFFKGDLHSLLSQDEVMKVREVLRIEILEELGIDCSEIRKNLKQDNK